MEPILSRVRFIGQDDQELSFAELAEIDFGAVGHKEILQNLRTLLLTPIWTVALNRLFGMDYLYLDMPMNQQRDILVGEILEKIMLWEPRIIVKDVSFDPDANVIGGQTIPRLHIRISNTTFAGLPYSDYLKQEVF